MTYRIAAAIAGLALAVSACAGPRTPLEVEGKEIPVDILLGARTAAERPPALDPGPAGFPGFVQPPLPRPQPGVFPTPPLPGACPQANPSDAVRYPARLSAPYPPVEATYAYRNEGSFRVGEAAESVYPPTTERTITNVRAIADGNFEFDVATSLLGETTTTRYRVLNEGTTPERGVFIVSIVTARDDGAEAFVPTTPIQLLPFPPPEQGTNLEDETADLAGREYRSSGTDPISQTTMVLEARADTKTRVDACGAWVDGYEVEVLRGEIVGPVQRTSFTGRIVVATQYGGIIVEDDLTIEGLDGLDEIAAHDRARITQLPEAPPGLF